MVTNFSTYSNAYFSQTYFCLGRPLCCGVSQKKNDQGCSAAVACNASSQGDSKFLFQTTTCDLLGLLHRAHSYYYMASSCLTRKHYIFRNPSGPPLCLLAGLLVIFPEYFVCAYVYLQPRVYLKMFCQQKKSRGNRSSLIDSRT